MKDLLKQQAHYFFVYVISGFLVLLAGTFLLRVLFMFIAQRPLSNLGLDDVLYSLFWGIRFDLAAAAIATSFIAIPTAVLVRVFGVRRLSLLPFAIALVLFATVQIGDSIYFLEAGRHSGYEIWVLLEEFSGLLATALQDSLLLVLFALLLAVLIIVPVWGRRVSIQGSFPSVEISFLLWCVIATLCMRGSLHEKPMKPVLVFNLGNDDMAAIAENPSYTTIYTLYLGKQSKPVFQGFTKLSRDVYHHLVQEHLLNKEPKNVAPQKHYNVILFALEGWPSYYMNNVGNEHATTPEFNALAARGFTTDGLIAEGHRTSEGLFSMLCSYPNPLGEAIINNELISNHYECLPRILSNNGWETALFQGMHTGEVGSMGQKLGLSKSYGKNDVGNLKYPENNWGIDDHDLFDFMLEKIKQAKKPFFYVVNTTNTHDDVLPEDVPYTFGSETKEERKKSILYYSDEALGKFVRQLEATLHEPTLLVITSDHTRGLMPDRFSDYHIPFTMLVLNQPFEKRHIKAIASQRDVAPTIMEWLGGHIPWFTGQSLWSLTEKDFRASYYTAGLFAFFTGTRMVEFPLSGERAMNCFNWNSDVKKLDGSACDESDSLSEQKARAYIEYSQSLLFRGKTVDYGSEPLKD